MAIPAEERLAAIEADIKHILMAVDDLKQNMAPRVSWVEAGLHRQDLELEKLKSEIKIQRIAMVILAVGSTASGGAIITKLLGAG